MKWKQWRSTDTLETTMLTMVSPQTPFLFVSWPAFFLGTLFASRLVNQPSDFTAIIFTILHKRKDI